MSITSIDYTFLSDQFYDSWAAGGFIEPGESPGGDEYEVLETQEDSTDYYGVVFKIWKRVTLLPSPAARNPTATPSALVEKSDMRKGLSPIYMVGMRRWDLALWRDFPVQILPACRYESIFDAVFTKPFRAFDQ